MDQIMQLGGVGFWGTVLIGILAGWLAEKFTGSDHGLIMNLIIGLVGSWIGFFVANAAGILLLRLARVDDPALEFSGA